MQATQITAEYSDSQARDARYAQCINTSRRIRWDIDRDVIRGRKFDYTQKFLPDRLSLVNELDFLTAGEQRFLSQIQGRTYANIFGLVERFINAKVLELGQQQAFGSQVVLEALVRFSDEELKHQELFRRLEAMTAEGMPEGYVLTADPNEVATVVLGRSTWAVLALTCHIELFTQQHYKESIEVCEGLSALYKDVFLYHWREESQHAIIDELEWREEDVGLSEQQRDSAVDDLIALVGAVDGILQNQASADAAFFIARANREFVQREVSEINEQLIKAYRWQYIVSGIQNGKFTEILAELVTPAQLERVVAALAPLMACGAPVEVSEYSALAYSS